METIHGIITRVNYYNPENGYTVVVLELDYKDKTIAMKKSKIVGNTITVVGSFDREPQTSEEYSFDGDFVRDTNYGLQFKFTRFQRKLIKTELGIISYLSSDMFPSIGPKIAKMIIDKLGLNCLSIIQENEDALDGLKITDKQKSIIRMGILSDQINQETVVYFLDNGLSLDMAHKIISIFGNMAKQIVQENPYILMEKIERFGFKKNDVFALKIGIKEDSLVRLNALVGYVLHETLYNLGNSYIAKMDLYDQITRYLTKEIDATSYEQVLEHLVKEKKLFIDQNKNIFDYKMYMQELELALELAKMLKDKRDIEHKMITYEKEDIESNYYKIKSKSHIEFSKEQENAILSAFTEPIIIITGGPGTGKTTIIKAIIEMFFKLNKDNNLLADYIALLAPTGKAAKRLKESTNMSSMTIHKFLGYTGGNNFTYSKYNKTISKLIIIDEASMMDLPIASRLITSMQDDARLIIVGDVDQLPSVGPGQVLKDLIDSREIKTIRLTKIHRQAENSSIIQLAHHINEGILSDNILEKLNDRVFIATDNAHLSTILVDATSRYISRGYDIKKDLQILIPMYKGDCGINEINARIQELINPLEEDRFEIKHFGQVFRENDKVIQLVNRAEKGIMNGDVGYIESFIFKDLKIIGLKVVFDQAIVEYTIDELEDLSLAYAISIHKAQGCEFDIVIMPISSKHFIMLKRKLIYTAITRAKKILILIGDVQMMKQAIRRVENNRKTILKNKLIEYVNYNEDLDKKEENPFAEDEDELGSVFSELKLEDFNKINV